MMNPIVLMFALFNLMNTSWAIASVLIIGVVTFFVVNLVLRQESILYVPCVLPDMQTPLQNPDGMRSPADRGLVYEDVRLRTHDDVKLHGWFISAGANTALAPTILFCHANAGNIGLRIPNFQQIVEKLQANIFALDYRGYGYSEGTPSEDGLIEDASCAWRWLQATASEGRINGRKIFVFGRSLGGAVAVALAVTLQQQQSTLVPAGLILENTFVSISAVVDSLFPLLAFRSLKDRFLRLKWESSERIKSLKVPVLVLTGEKDEMIPPWHSRVLYESAIASSDRRRESFAEGSHNDTWERGGKRYWEVQASFLRECSYNELNKRIGSCSVDGAAAPL